MPGSRLLRLSCFAPSFLPAFVSKSCRADLIRIFNEFSDLLSSPSSSPSSSPLTLLPFNRSANLRSSSLSLLLDIFSTDRPPFILSPKAFSKTSCTPVRVLNLVPPGLPDSLCGVDCFNFLPTEMSSSSSRRSCLRYLSISRRSLELFKVEDDDSISF